MKTTPINPQQLRRIPKQFSWIDHRLIRQGYLQRCNHTALSLYLFYLVVADAKGMSYYSDARLISILSMTQNQLHRARQDLISQRLMAYAHPFVQVLSLEGTTTVSPTVRQTANPQSQSSSGQPPICRGKHKALIQQLQAQLRNHA